MGLSLSDEQRLRWAAKTNTPEADTVMAEALAQGGLERELLGNLMLGAIQADLVPRVDQLLAGGAPADFIWNSLSTPGLQSLVLRAVARPAPAIAEALVDRLMAHRFPGDEDETPALLRALTLERWALADRLVSWTTLSNQPSWANHIGAMPVALLDRLLARGGDPWALGHVAALHVGVAHDVPKMARLLQHTPFKDVMQALWAMREDYLESAAAIDGWSVWATPAQLDRLLAGMGPEALPHAQHRRLQLQRADSLAQRPAAAPTASRRQRS